MTAIKESSSYSENKNRNSLVDMILSPNNGKN